MIEAVDRHQPARRMALYGGACALAAGFALHAMWRVLPWERLALSLLLALVAAGAAWPLRRFARWSWASSLALPWSLALLWFAGPPAVVATLALLAAAAAIGLGWLAVGTPGRLPLATVTGLATLAGLGGWIITWPVHHAWAWRPLVLALVAWRWRVLRTEAGVAVAGWRATVAKAPGWAALAVMLLGLASTACWLPTMQADDLRYHLGLPSQLLMLGAYRPDPAHQVWAFAPWAGDALQGFAAVLAGGHARGGLNAAWLALAAASLWTAGAGVGAHTSERWACVALFASLPPLVWMAAGMQTELPATAVLLALAALVVLPESAVGPSRLYPGAILFGALMALKGVHVLTALPLLGYAAWHHRHALPWRRVPVALLLVAAIGGASYLQSWWQTGNPVLPLFNGVFESSYFPAVDYRDPRWHAGFGPGLPWRITFDTDRYVEALDGGFGFVLVGLAGAWLVALLSAPSRALTLALTLALLLSLAPLQYARYAYPALALLPLALLPHARRRFGTRHFRWMVLGLCLLNLAFQANASWLHHSAALKRTLRAAGDPVPVEARYVPELVLLREIPAGDDGVVLATDPERGYVAGLGGRGRVVFEHDPGLQAARAVAEADATGTEWLRLFAANDVRWLLVSPAQAGPSLDAALQRGATRVDGLGEVELWRVAGREHAR
ncbi:MAG TPA: hypothetical protein VFF71_08235 [Luteimonas sp.]|nr:hypothetical protein [Luteimonas sp.]